MSNSFELTTLEQTFLYSGLNDDIIILIGNYLNFNDLVTLCEDNNLKTRKICQGDSLLFENIFKKDFGDKKPKNKTWKGYYQEVQQELKNKNLDGKLIYASGKGLLTKVKHLVEVNKDDNVDLKDHSLTFDQSRPRGVDIHIFNDWALQLAVEYVHLDVVKYLVQGNFSPETNERDAKYLVEESIGHDGKYDDPKDRFLTSGQCRPRGVDIHAFNDRVLKLTARNDHNDVVKYLIEQGADTSVLRR